MPSIVSGYNYDIFISYRQKDNKGDRWVSKFVEALKTELEATFKEDISVYFDENPHDRLQETHNVDKSLEGKLKCLIFIPILSQTYCDPSSYAWQNEFLAFIEMAEDDRFGKDVKLRSGNVASRILPIKIHDLESEDVKLFEKETGSVLRAMDFVFKTGSGVNRPLLPDDSKNDNLNKTLYRDQINKVAGAIKEVILAITKESESIIQEKVKKPAEDVFKSERNEKGNTAGLTIKSQRLLLLVVSLFLIIAGAVAIYNVINHSKDPKELINLDKSIAVLPFSDDSPNKDNEYFCNGMMEDILNNLVKIKELNVKSRTDVEAYRGIKKSRKEIAEELGVLYLLEGSVRKQGNQFRLMVQLIDAKTGFHRWSQPYEGEALDIFKVQAEIAKKVADELEVVLSSDQKIELEKIPTSNIEAYEYFILAREEGFKYWGNRDINQLMKSIELINKALKLDPEFEEALWYKGNSFLGFGQYDSVRIYANRLLTVNPSSFNGWYLLGDFYRFTSDPLPAIENYKNALRYSGNQMMSRITQINLWIGSIYCLDLNNYKEGFPYLYKCDSTNYIYWMYLGGIFGSIDDFERAEKYLRISVEFEHASVATYLYSIILCSQSKYDEALKILDKYCKTNTEELPCIRGRMYNHIFKKDYEKALIDVKAINKFSNQLIANDSVLIAWIYKNTGREKEASEIIQKSLNSYKMESLTDKGSTPYLFSSFLYGMLGEKEKALEQLSKAVDFGFIWGFYHLPEIAPFYGNISNDPEFKAIIKRAKDKAEKSRAEVDEMRKRGEINF